MTGHKWLHSATEVHQKGKVKIQCLCGAQSKWFAKDDKSQDEWWVAHTKLTERKEKR